MNEAASPPAGPPTEKVTGATRVVADDPIVPVKPAVSLRDREILNSLARRVMPGDARGHNDLGVLLYRKGMVIEALDQLLLATHADPWAAAARANLALVAQEPGVLSALIVDRTRRPTWEAEGDESYRLARVFLAAGRLEPAKELLSRWIEAATPDSVAFLEMGSLELQAGNPAAALQPLTRALRDRPTDVSLHLVIAAALADVGRPGQALGAARAACRIAPDQPEPYEMLARLLASSSPAEAEAMGEYAETLRLGRGGDARPTMARLEVDTPVSNPVGGVGRAPGTSAFRLGHYHEAIALRQHGAFVDALAALGRANGPDEPADLVALARAEILLVQGQPAEAARYYRELLERNPGSPKLWNELGVCHHVGGELHAAVRCYTRALACDPDYVPAESNTGVAEANRGRILRARERLSLVSAESLAIVEGRYNLGILELESGDPQAAESAFRGAVDLDPSLAKVWVGLSSALSELGKLEEAKQVAARALELAPASGEAHYRLAMILDRLGESTDAMRESGDPLAADPPSAESHFLLAVDLNFPHPDVLAPGIGSQKNVGSEDSLFIDWTALPPGEGGSNGGFETIPAGMPQPVDFESPDVYLGDPSVSRALTAIRQVVLRGGDRIMADLLAGEVLHRHGRDEEALERYELAIARLAGAAWSEQHFRAWVGRGRCLLARGEASLALEDAERVRMNAPFDPAAIRLLTDALIALGRGGEAAENLYAMSERLPHDAEWRLRLGRAEMAAGQLEEARLAFERALAIDAELVAGHIELGRLSLLLGEPRTAVDHAEKALALLPGYAEAAILHADGLRALGRPQDALASLREILDYDPGHLATILRLGEVLQDTGQPAEARSAFRSALRVDPGSSFAWERLADSFAGEGRHQEAESCRATAEALVSSSVTRATDPAGAFDQSTSPPEGTR